MTSKLLINVALSPPQKKQYEKKGVSCITDTPHKERCVVSKGEITKTKGLTYVVVISQ